MNHLYLAFHLCIDTSSVSFQPCMQARIYHLPPDSIHAICLYHFPLSCVNIVQTALSFPTTAYTILRQPSTAQASPGRGPSTDHIIHSCQLAEAAASSPPHQLTSCNTIPQWIRLQNPTRGSQMEIFQKMLNDQCPATSALNKGIPRPSPPSQWRVYTTSCMRTD